MKKVIFLVVILFILALGGFLAYMSPHLVYSSLLSGKWKPAWFNAGTDREFFLVGSSTTMPALPAKVEDTDALWKHFHVGEFDMPLPVRHPLYSVVPIVEFTGAKTPPRLGVSFQGQTQKHMLSVYFLNPIPFSTSLQDERIYSVPLVRSYLRSHAPALIWKDLLTKDLRAWNRPMPELVYNLYLLTLRQHFFTPTMQRYALVGDGPMAIVTMNQKNPEYTAELVMLYDGQHLIRPYLLQTHHTDPHAMALRSRLMHELTVRSSSQKEAGMIYDEFKALAYNEKIGEEGMLYLFSAWTHWTDSRDFLKEVIKYLERGNGNLAQLKPLYAYAFKRFGTTLSTKDDSLKENADEALQRKMKEESQKEILDAQKRKVVDPDKLSGEERIRYMLRQSKDKNVKDTDKDERLIVD